MPPTDASTDAGTAPATERAAELATDTGPRSGPGSGSGASTDGEDTLDLRLPDELIALFAGEAGTRGGATGDATAGDIADVSGGDIGDVSGGGGESVGARRSPPPSFRPTTCSTASVAGGPPARPSVSSTSSPCASSAISRSSLAG